MSHVNAVLTPRTRLRLARMIVDGKHPVSHVAKLFMVSPVPARKWADRYRAEGATGMKDRSSRVNRLSRIGRVTGEPLRRYEHDRPGSLIHVDVTKFGNIPDGGGWRFVGKQQGDWNRQATARRTGQRNSRSEPRLGTAFVHTVLDDHSRVAYAEIHSDEKAVTAISVLERATTRQLL